LNIKAAELIEALWKAIDMRRIKLSSLALGLLIFCCRDAVPQSANPQQVTVNQAVQEAIDKNLGLLAERYNLTIAEAKIVTARLRPNPVFSLEAGHLNYLVPNGNPTGAGPNEYAVRTDFLLERGNKRQYRIEAAEQARAVAQMQLLNSIRQLALDVQNAFVEVLLAEQTVALAQQNQASFKRIVQISTDRVRAGDLAQIELARTELAELQFDNAVIQAKAKLRIAKQRLQLLMGRLAPTEAFEVSGELRHEPLPSSLEDLQRQAINSRPDYLALQRDQARSLAEVRSQIAQGRVDYTIGAEYRRQQAPAFGNLLGFFFSVPLPVFNRNQGEIERARQEQRQIEARIRALEAEICNQLSTAWQQYDAARALVARIESDMLAKARCVLETMEYSYRAGAASLVEFLDAQRAFNDTMQGYNESRAEYARSLYLIDSVTGKEITK
jgi:cobalt-zinc-cadmium efflux system outer membrane protein